MSPVRPKVTVVGRRLDPDDHRLLDGLTRIAQPHLFLEAGTVAADAALADAGLDGSARLPVLIDGGSALEGVTMTSLVEAWGMTPATARQHYDMAIIGAGPAGLAAAVYAAS